MGTEDSPYAAAQMPAVLVVEDDVLIRMATCESLESCGFTVFEAASLDEARLVFSTGAQIDAIFSDIDLGDNNGGIALALWAAQHHPDIPVILTSGVFGAQRAAALACKNVREFVEKPYSHADIETVLRRALTTPRASQ